MMFSKRDDEAGGDNEAMTRSDEDAKEIFSSPLRLLLPSRLRVILWVLLALFCLRVIGQMLVAFWGVTFLPPMEEWYSGLLPYPLLLPSQFLIILLYGKVCLDFSRRRGFFFTPRRSLGKPLLIFGWIYLGAMVIRYIIRMSLYPDERWFGGSIPIFFHWVLAAFILLVGCYHWMETRSKRGAEW